MSLKAMGLVWDYSRHKGTQLLLMLAIADHADDDLICWPGRKRLARKIRMSERYTIQLIDALLAGRPPELLLLEAGGGRGHSPRYKIAIIEKGEPRLTLSIEKGEPRLTLSSEIKGEARLQERVRPAPQRVRPASVKGELASSPEPSLTLINRQLTVSEKQAAEADIRNWVMADLSKSANLPKTKREELAEANPIPGAFVSKYLYALAHPGFRKPALWAASQVIDEPGEFSGEPFRTLGHLDPAGLAQVLAWLRDDAAYSPSANGATSAALAFRGHLAERHAKQPAAMYVAIDDAISDLGLDALAAPITVSGDAGQGGEEIPVVVRDPWQVMVDDLEKSVPQKAVALLRRCAFMRESAGEGLTIAVPSSGELAWLMRMFARQLTERHISLELAGV